MPLPLLTGPDPSRRRALALLAVAAALGPARVAAAEEGDLERSVKAAFLYKFLLYVEFPVSAFSDPAAPLIIGVVAADAMAAELSRMVAGRQIRKRTVTVRTLRESEIGLGVHLLFVGGADMARLGRLCKASPPGPTLVVTEAENALQYGSVINFIIVAQRVRFDISLDAADKNNVKLSSRLLAVANHVHKGAP